MKLIEKFLLFEEQNNLFDSKIKNIEFWHIIRFRVYSILYQAINRTKNYHPKRNLVESSRLILKNFYFSLLNNPFLLNTKDQIIFGHSRRVLNEDGFYICKYTEHLNSEISYVFESPFQESHLKPTKSNNVIHLDLVLNLSRLFTIIGNLYYFSEGDKLIIKELLLKIELVFGVKIQNGENLILKLILKHIAIRFFAKKILKRVNPKEIIVTIAYSDLNMPFVEQAKKMGIKVIEQQHGIMGDTHLAYNFLKPTEFKWFPDEIWVWSEFWSENTRLPISKDKILIKGFPFLDNFKKIKVQNYNNKSQILIISQGPFSNKLIDLAISLNKIIDKKIYSVAYKLHPSEVVEKDKMFSILSDNGIKILTENNIYNVFSESYCQIGVNSTALFEGIEFGLKTFIFKTEGWEVFRNVKNVIFFKDELEVVKNL